MSTPEATELLPEHKGRVDQALQDLDYKAGADRWQHLDSYYDHFRAQFGPQALAGLDGVALLERMHKREGQNCLMYWLEFKNDDEFAPRRSKARFCECSRGTSQRLRASRRRPAPSSQRRATSGRQLVGSCPFRPAPWPLLQRQYHT